MPKLILKGHIVVQAHDLNAVIAALPEHIKLTEEESGCLIFRVEQDPQNAHIFKVYEEFTDKGAFEAHQARVKSSRWGKITENVERHYQISSKDL